MNRLNQLPEISEQILSGLKADNSLKHRILLAASESPKQKIRFQTVVALCSLSILLILLCVFAGSFSSGSRDSIQVISAGSHRLSAPVDLQDVVDKASDLIKTGP